MISMWKCSNKTILNSCNALPTIKTKKEKNAEKTTSRTKATTTIDYNFNYQNTLQLSCV